MFPKKAAKEQLVWDIMYHRMRTSLEAAFPDPVKRLQYISDLIKGLEDDSEELK
jgi:hypothetical protein